MSPWGLSLAAAAAIAAAAWAASLRLRDASIADVVWGPLFIAVAGVGWVRGGGAPGRKALVVALTVLWGARLAWHIGRRSLGRPEDRRYAEMRERHGVLWPLKSLFHVFLLQAALAWCVALPVQAALCLPAAPALGALDAAGAALFALGLAFEAVADAQLSRFLERPENRGRVLDRGLWRYSRHPNYFGDAVLWWGLGLLGCSAGAPWSLAGPGLMTFLLMRISGVTLLERSIAQRRPDYARYKAATSAFVPWFPRPPADPDPAGPARAR